MVGTDCNPSAVLTCVNGVCIFECCASHFRDGADIQVQPTPSTRSTLLQRTAFSDLQVLNEQDIARNQCQLESREEEESGVHSLNSNDAVGRNARLA